MSSTTSRRGRTRQQSAILYRYAEGVRRLKHQDPVDLVDDVDQDARYLGVDLDAEFTNEPPRLPIPASGGAYHDCGDRKPLLFCDRCGKPHHVARRCWRSTCPECWESWAIQRGTEITAKLEARRAYEESIRDGWDGWKFHHVVLSPPPGIELRRADALDAAVESAKLLCSEVGLDEGALVYHPWRIKEEHRGDVLGHSSGEGDMTWRHMLHRIERDGFEAVRDEYLVFAPHFHALGLSKHVTGGDMTEHLEEQSGWVVHRIADDDGVSLGDIEALAAAATYSVSHAGVRETGRGMDAAYRYFGTVANFEPREHIRERAFAAVAAVSETVLGVEPRGSRCGERVQVPAVDADHQERIRELAVEAAGNSSSGGAAGSGGGGSKVEIEACGGRLRSMADAPDRLRDGDWMDRAPHAAELPPAYREYLIVEEQRDREHLGGGPPPPP